MRSYNIEQFHMGRLARGEDLLHGLVQRVHAAKILSGYIWAVGTLDCSAFRSPGSKPQVTLDGPLEIVTCTGNVSQKNSRSVLHLHMGVADRKGRVHGGHVVPGNRVVVLEFCVAEFSGPPLVRERDNELGLDLWTADEL